jgi:hypothetical protein
MLRVLSDVFAVAKTKAGMNRKKPRKRVPAVILFSTVNECGKAVEENKYKAVRITGMTDTVARSRGDAAKLRKKDPRISDLVSAYWIVISTSG